MVRDARLRRTPHHEADCALGLTTGSHWSSLDVRMPEILIIAGPNGAGKTTFASEYLSVEMRDFEFVNADEIARHLDQSFASDILAGRLMLSRIDELVGAKASFGIETTLASLTYAQKIPIWRSRGYKVTLNYLRLASPEASIARVAKRVSAGGHGIPETTIRRRFGKSYRYFETAYKPIVDLWYLWESGENEFVLIDSWEH